MNNFESRSDVIDARQSSFKRLNYHLDNMVACIDRGNLRLKQEDAVLLLCHPKNNDFKLLAVADGMGGLHYGEKASNLTLRKLITWFEKLPSNYFLSSSELSKIIDDELEDIDEYIRMNIGDCGTTLSLAIHTFCDTILLNVGDSRIYLTDSSGVLSQVSNDQSTCWDLYKDGVIKEKKDIMFHKKNNLIFSRLGCAKKKLTIEKNIFKNSDYDSVFLFTDGVTDCLSDDILNDIVSASDNMSVATNIIDSVLTTSAYNTNLNSDEYFDCIPAGKDNATVAALLKNRKLVK